MGNLELHSRQAEVKILRAEPEGGARTLLMRLPPRRRYLTAQPSRLWYSDMFWRANNERCSAPALIDCPEARQRWDQFDGKRRYPF